MSKLLDVLIKWVVKTTHAKHSANMFKFAKDMSKILEILFSGNGVHEKCNGSETCAPTENVEMS